MNEIKAKNKQYRLKLMVSFIEYTKRNANNKWNHTNQPEEEIGADERRRQTKKKFDGIKVPKEEEAEENNEGDVEREREYTSSGMQNAKDRDWRVFGMSNCWYK